MRKRDCTLSMLKPVCRMKYTDNNSHMGTSVQLKQHGALV
jgi:hypothetical protein